MAESVQLDTGAPENPFDWRAQLLPQNGKREI
jgi:hypothetical protein